MLCDVMIYVIIKPSLPSSDTVWPRGRDQYPQASKRFEEIIRDVGHRPNSFVP